MADQNTIALIKELRERTGAGMMDCKKALENNNYDIEKAVDVLREKGLAKQATRAGRTAAEGMVAILEDDKKAIIAEINCETDFVARSDKFINLMEGTLKILDEKAPATIEEANELNKDLMENAGLALGEKLVFRRFAIVAKEGCTGTYIHKVDGVNKIGVIVVLSKEDEELAKALSMHIAANAPLYVALEDVPAEVREREINIAKAEVAADEKLINKPEAVKEGIISRKADKVLGQSCLSLQKYLLDDSKTVGQVLSEKGNSVIKFVRYELGDGVAK